MKKMIELEAKRARLLNDAKEFFSSHRLDDGSLSSEDEKTYQEMIQGAYALGNEIGRLREQARVAREFERMEEQKPVLGVKPCYVAAWQRIGELAEAIERQYESPNGDTELVQKWAAEIGWQCSMIESLKEGET